MAAIDYASVAQEVDALGVGAQTDVRGILAGAGNPWDSYSGVPVGSRYFKSNGTWYWKSGAGDTSGDWTEIQGGGAFIQRFTFQADQLENPINSSWAVNSLAEAAADTVHSDLIVRLFDDTTEAGVGARFTVPTGATYVTFYIKSKAQSAPGSTQGVQPTLYHSIMEDNASWGAWSSALNLTAISIPTNTNLQYDTQIIALSSLGWSVDDFVRIELTRRGTQGGDTLSGNWNLAEIILEFT